jgi:hypothetical protein
VRPFPGRLSGQPIAYATLHRWLRDLGFPLAKARVSALRQLVLQAPAPVIADALASTRPPPPDKTLYPHGGEVPEFLLHIDKGEAWWRWSNQPFNEASPA